MDIKEQKQALKALYQLENLFFYSDGRKYHCFYKTGDEAKNNDAVEITYGGEISMVEFAWRMFPLGILNNIITNSPDVVRFPVLDDDGDIESLWNKYSIKEFSVKELYDEE